MNWFDWVQMAINFGLLALIFQDRLAIRYLHGYVKKGNPLGRRA
jgi:hypothetical protein